MEYTNVAVMKGCYFAIIANEVSDSSNNHAFCTWHMQQTVGYPQQTIYQRVTV